MSKPTKEKAAPTRIDATQVETRKVTLSVLATSAGAILMLVAFTTIPDPTLQLAVISISGLLIGGLR